MTTSEAASVVGVIAGFTVSTAASGATIGSRTPQACAVATAFRMICAFASRSGAIFIAASVTKADDHSQELQMLQHEKDFSCPQSIVLFNTL